MALRTGSPFGRVGKREHHRCASSRPAPPGRAPVSPRLGTRSLGWWATAGGGGSVTQSVVNRPPHRSRMLGRRAECEAVDRLLADVLVGQSGVLVLRGEAGVGKTALLRYGAEEAAGCRVARAAGV